MVRIKSPFFGLSCKQKTYENEIIFSGDYAKLYSINVHCICFNAEMNLVKEEER